ncbi:MAG: DUF1565 domain-containing protein [Cyanobacteria bacterium P01_H01_bin.15]
MQGFSRFTNFQTLTGYRRVSGSIKRWQWWGLLVCGFCLTVGLSLGRTPITLAAGETHYVNPSNGADGNPGTARKPWQTLNYSIDAAQADETLMLERGVYELSEPLRIPSGLKLQGRLRDRGQKVIIQGNLAQKPLIVLGGKSELAGLTIENPKGHGILITAGSPKIRFNTIQNHNGVGIQIQGKSQPQVEGNWLSQNKTAIAALETSQPELLDNVIADNQQGFVATGQTWSTLTNNQFKNTSTAIFLGDQAQAKLRRNQITDASTTGLITFALAKADLGTRSEPGGNRINQREGLFAMQNRSQEGEIAAFGNQINGRVEGPINQQSQRSPLQTVIATQPTAPTPSTISATAIPSQTPTHTGKEMVFTAPTARTIERPTPTSPQAVSPPLSRSTTPLRPITSSSPSNPIPVTPTLKTTGTRPVASHQILPPPPVRSSTAGQPLNGAGLPTSPTSATVPQPSRNHNMLPPPPQPDEQRDLGDIIAVAPAQNQGNLLPVPPTPIPASGATPLSASQLQGTYKVLVSPRNPRQQETVRSQYPEAFTTNYQGQSWLQVGIFRERSKAERILQSLQTEGVQGTVIAL